MNSLLKVGGGVAAPQTYALSHLLTPVSCFVVRMTRFPERDNRDEHGGMIWPEVLVCENETQALALKNFLNIRSYQDSRDLWISEEPYLSEQELRDRWIKEDMAHYDIEAVPDLTKYEEMYRISESILVAFDLFENEIEFEV